MKRHLLLAVSVAVAFGAVVGCKDDRPTPMQFDPSKANYTGQQKQYTKGATQPTGDATTTQE
jgi:hypothetical protein